MKEEEPLNTEELEKAYTVAYLIAGHIRKTLTSLEREELDAWLEESEKNIELFEDLTDEANIQKSLEIYDRLKKEKALKRVQQKIPFVAPKRKRILRFLPLSVAAAIVVILAISIVLWIQTKKVEQPAQQQITQQEIIKDIEPGGNKATLTLANGSKIILDSAANGNVAIQGNTVVQKKEGSLSYNSEGQVGIKQDPVINVLHTPNGGQYNITLSDGTEVWLNAASSLRFPTAFTDKERVVQLTGEGYFMVKHSDRPFKVKVASHVVEDLGTTFNINAYNDEGMDKTTLIEGSIKVIKSKVEKILQPGEQAIINEQDIRIQKGDIASATGWRMGKFVYRFAPVSNVLSDLERWYNITVVNKEANKNHLKATIDRNVPLSQMIRILEGTGQIHLKWDGNKLTALP